MKRHARLLSSACLALICAGAISQMAATEESLVLTQDLKKLRAPGRVGAVLWTRRDDSYTLQIVVHRPGFEGRGAVRISRPPQQASQAQRPRFPQIQAWLLRSDGRQIQPTRRMETPADPDGKCQGRCIASEVMYSFSLADGKEAVAAALSVDDDYHVEQLKPFE